MECNSGGENLNSSQKQENNDNDENDTQAPRRHVAPLAAVRPPRQGTYERQDQKDNQDRSKHDLLLSK